MKIALRRSLLFVPGSSEKMLRKAAERGADVLILDLEDGVHPDRKEEARDALARLVGELDFGRAEVLVRVNPPDSPWGGADLESAARLSIAGVVLPKVENPDRVDAVDRRLASAVPLLLMIETAAGVVSAPELARSSPRVSGLVFGAADYRASMRCGSDSEERELWFARNQIAHAARAADVAAFDTPWFEYRDREGLAASAGRARLLGFEGKCALHPEQVPVINEIFSPTDAEVERSRRIVETMERALEEGRSVATLDGEMIEILHLREARRTLARAEQAARAG